MQIKDLSKMKNGQRVLFKAVLANKRIQQSSNNSEFLSLTLVDSTGTLTTPIFDNMGVDLYEVLNIGDAYQVEAVINIWNNNVQLKMSKYKRLEEGEYSKEDFINSYEISEDVMLDFTEIIHRIKQPYSKLIRYALNNAGMEQSKEKGQAEFLIAPSAEKNHGNKLGGLFLHTYGMLKTFESILGVYDNLKVYGDIREVVNVDRMYLKIIFHDIMKIKEYEYKTFIKRKQYAVGHLIDGPAFFDEVNRALDNIIGEEEAENIKYSLLSHHGKYGPFEPKTLEDKLLHQLDMIDSQIVGALESNE